MQEMSYLQDNSKVEALTKAVLISILAVAIILSNLVIIATYANFKGKFVNASPCRCFPQKKWSIIQHINPNKSEKENNDYIIYLYIYEVHILS